jgi:hypothetical protein
MRRWATRVCLLAALIVAIFWVRSNCFPGDMWIFNYHVFPSMGHGEKFTISSVSSSVTLDWDRYGVIVPADGLTLPNLGEWNGRWFMGTVIDAPNARAAGDKICAVGFPHWFLLAILLLYPAAGLGRRWQTRAARRIGGFPLMQAPS